MDTNKPLLQSEMFYVSKNLQQMREQGIFAKTGITDNELVRLIQDYIDQFKEVLKHNDGAETIHQAYKMLNDYFRKDFDKQIKEKITCKKGCSFCCHINVDCTQMEVDLILQYIRAYNIPVDAKVLELHAKSTMKERPLLEKSACVFLSAEGNCNIYDVRPLACRKYFIVSDPTLCNYKTNPLDNVKIYPDLQMELVTSALVNIQQPENMASLLQKKIKP